MLQWDRGSTVVKVLCYSGTAVAQWLRCCATNRKVAGSIPASVSGFFIDIKSFRSHYGPGVDSASNRNEYREYFLGGKGGRCVGLALLPSCAVTKSGNLNFLEASGPLHVCNRRIQTQTQGLSVTTVITQNKCGLRLCYRFLPGLATISSSKQ